jgi:hypothetical protein
MPGSNIWIKKSFLRTVVSQVKSEMRRKKNVKLADRVCYLMFKEYFGSSITAYTCKGAGEGKVAADPDAISAITGKLFRNTYICVCVCVCVNSFLFYENDSIL